MISIQIIAAILLIIRIFSIVFMSSVIRKQFRLFKLPIREEVRMFRVVLFILAIVILIGNAIPVIVDTVTLLTDVPRSPFLSHLSVTYALSNAITSLSSSLLIWFLYRISEDSHRK